MKRIFIILVLMLTFTFINKINAQQNMPHKIYAELVGQSGFFSKTLTINIDFGQETDFWNQWNQKLLVDENGKEIKFNSMVDAMNYMGKFGWEFEQAYTVTVDKTNVYHWLMSKFINEDNQQLEGIKTKQDFIDKE